MTLSLARMAPLAALVARDTGLDGPAPRQATYRGAALSIERGGF